MLTIEIKNAAVVTKSGNARVSGKPYTIREQEGYADLGGAYPEKIRFSLGDDQAPFPVGKYVVDKTCFRVGQFNGLALDLRSMKAAAARVA